MQQLDQTLGGASDLSQIYKVFTIQQKEKILTPAFVKFTNFVRLYLGNDRYFFNSLKSYFCFQYIENKNNEKNKSHIARCGVKD